MGAEFHGLSEVPVCSHLPINSSPGFWPGEEGIRRDLPVGLLFRAGESSVCKTFA